MRNLVFFVTVVVLVIVGWRVFNYIPHQPIYLNPNNQNIPVVPPKSDVVESVIQAVNQKNAQIKSVVCNDVDIMLQSGLVLRLQGKLAYEKDKKFRMLIERKRLNIKETDIGSNENYFWFWSRSMEPPALYYATHENVLNTRLKSPFHPIWMMECLSVNELDVAGASVHSINGNLAFTQPRKGTMNRQMTKTTIVDPNSCSILGHYLYNDQGVLVASAEVKEFHSNGIPKEMLLIWHEEEIYMTWKLPVVHVNLDISPEIWQMPDDKEKIDMAGNEMGELSYANPSPKLSE